MAGLDACGSAFEVANKPEISPLTPDGSCHAETAAAVYERVAPAGRSGNSMWLWGALFIASLPVFLLNPGIFVGETVNSRLATVYALVHQGTWYIDTPLSEPPNPFEVMTVDKVQATNGRMLSSKPPVLPLMMAAEYAVLNKALGWTLNDQDDLRTILRVMIATLIKLPYLVGLVFFALLLRMFVPDDRKATLLLLFLAFASPVLGYSFQINNHTPSAAALCGVLYFGLGIYLEKQPPAAWRFAAFGLPRCIRHRHAHHRFSCNNRVPVAPEIQDAVPFLGGRRRGPAAGAPLLSDDDHYWEPDARSNPRIHVQFQELLLA